VGILAEVTSTISKMGANITEARTKSLPSGEALMDFTIQVEGYEEFLKILKALQSIEGVEDCKRLFS
ncbi:MAG: ACT domain-containing protein, partial [Aquificaceae bacterium]